MKRKTAELLGTLLGVVILAAFVAAIIVGGYFASKQKCRLSAEEMEMQWKFSYPTGCFVKTKNGWRPLKSMRVSE